MKCDIVNTKNPGFILLRMEAENDDERGVVAELQKLDRSDDASPIGSFGGDMVEVKVVRQLNPAIAFP